MLLHDLFAEALKNTPDKEAIIFKGRSTSYRELYDLMNRSARALLSLGIVRGDRVAIFMENRVELVELYFACFRICAIAVPLNHRYQTDEVIYAVNHCGAKVLIADGSLFPRAEGIKDSVQSLQGIYVFGDEPTNMENSWSRILKNLPENAEWPLVQENDPAMILYTSGSTNKPKGVTHTHGSIFHTASSRKISQCLTEEDVSLAATAICHAGASIGVTFPTLYAGGTVVILEKTDPVLFLEALIKHRPTRTVILPAQLLDAVEHPQAQSVDFNCLKEVECGGDQISHDLYEHFNKVAGYELNQLYGLTECEGACINPPFGLIKRGSIGKPREGVEIRLVNPDGKDVPDGEIGEILIKSASVMIGYWNDPENTKKTFLDGWLRTGDLGRRDEDGYHHFNGRIKEVIIKGGSNVAPGEVEEVIDDHPDVIISGVVGTPDPRYGQLIHAFIELKPGLENPPGEKELSAYAAKRLAAYKVPDRWTFVEELPRNEVGKIDRRGLHALAAKLDSK
ncbi:MAG TPA: AMP-binding protein [Thermodesulfobacteriota bacterium]|nr:AMP-binding protein [Thermodesulfobacteriota bacterium]